VLRLFNTLTKRVDEIQTLEPGKARMYTCGPTVYRYAHIGNLRTYLMPDWIRRVLESEGVEVFHVKNITDVGHMRQELVESGGDKMILAALEEGKTIGEIAQYYAESFHQDEARVNILQAHVFPWATHHIPEMIEIVEKLLANGYAYEAGGNVYFDVGRFVEYGKLSHNYGGDLLEGVRVEADPLKHDPRDFTLWKAAEPGRDVKWASPWGEGFPGWHIECSAMACKYLGEKFDIHTGGVDNIFPHHEDEIAQSEGAFGEPHVNYWIHAQHLLADGAKMAKSAGNVFLIGALVERGFDPLSFRYLCMTVRYRHRMNFTFNSLKASERALTNLRDRVWFWKNLPPLAELPPET
jgi:cysteinyl-tRNA synthetase